MKKTKRLFSLILVFALLFSTFEMVKISASTDETRYSVKHLQNGGFEDYVFTSSYKQPYKYDVEYWDTTAYGSSGTNGMFEFFKSKAPHFDVTKSNYPNNPEYLNVAEGANAAELNADEESSIYQRIKTVSGSTYTWGLYHRGRDITDRMVLIIGPEQSVDPSKPSKTGKDQFVRITYWLKNQFGVNYPETGCSKKYTVYSKPFAESGKFVNENSDEDKNISLVETDEINQEWSVWVISSPYCNTDEQYTQNGWSAYGTNAIDDYNDIIKGASSSLGYDCTYTVPKGQTNTIFAFCSLSSGSLADPDKKTYGNLLDGINFELYQPISSSITPGGIGGAENENIKITSDITSSKSMHSVVLDGNECTILTTRYDGEALKECDFIGAYVTINNDDGTSATKFVTPYTGNISELTDEELENLSKQYFINKQITDDDGKTWDYYYKISVDSPVSIHLIYTKAPFVLYDSNGGEEYYFSPNNTDGGNLIGFADYFQQVFHKDEEGQEVFVDTSDYYCNYKTVTDEVTGETVITPGFYISHAALPNKNWETNSDGTSPHKFCGWSLLDEDGKQAVIDGTHTVTYDPNEGSGGMVSFRDSEGNTIDNLLLDATHGITLTALWKFVHRAQAQTYDSASDSYINSAVGGTVEETLISDDLRAEDVKNYYQEVNGENRIECVDAAGNAGDKIMFKATPDYQNNYAFVGWYYKVKNENGTETEELRSTSTSIAVTVEEGKLNTYYARFQKKTLPVIFNYTPTGNPADYDYYDKSTDDKYGKYYQEVLFGETAVKPTGDSKSVKTWFTSPTERGTEYIFDFDNTEIKEKTNLYAGPSFAYNYFNYFRIKEPWCINTYGTVKVNGQYLDLKNNPDVTNYNVYMLKGTLGESTPLPSTIKNNKNTIKIGKSTNSEKLIYNTLTNTGGVFNRAGATYNNFYLFNMKTPVWVVFDFTYQGVKYTSTVKDRSLYNNITTYMKEAANGLYTDYPPETQAELRDAQTKLLESIQNMYTAVSTYGIEEPSAYADAAKVENLTYEPTTENPYTFESTTAIRNIEPWGLKYSFTVNSQDTTNIADYGAVVLTDKAGDFSEENITINDLLTNEQSVMYSNANSNIYSGENGAIEVYYVNNMHASDLNKNTYAVFFVKDNNNKFYYSDIVTNSYKSIADSDKSDTSNISKSIIEYSNALIAYNKLVEQAEQDNT